MAPRDYSSETDYYTQDLEKEGVVSIWIGMGTVEGDSGEIDVLQDLCGVGYYDLDSQESNCLDFEMLPLDRILGEISYAKSFIGEALSAAADIGVTHARWVVVQYDFAYDPSKVTRHIASDPVFLGIFPYSID